MKYLKELKIILWSSFLIMSVISIGLVVLIGGEGDGKFFLYLVFMAPWALGIYTGHRHTKTRFLHILDYNGISFSEYLDMKNNFEAHIDEVQGGYSGWNDKE